MNDFSVTYIIRHARENLKKCSLRGLEQGPERDPRFLFFTYPHCLHEKDPLPNFEGCILLDIEGEPLSNKDASSNILLLDATWRLAQKMARLIPQLQNVPRRSLPKGFQTAYPRRQPDCIDPEQGLASIEALYIAFFLLNRPCEYLLDGYYWKDLFLQKNSFQSIAVSSII